MKTARDREEFCWFMGREGYPLDLCRKLMREAATIQRLMETACNQGLTERERKRLYSARARVAELSLGNGYYPKTAPFVVEFDGDPRGACVKLKLPSGRGNDFGGEGLLCVPA